MRASAHAICIARGTHYCESVSAAPTGAAGEARERRLGESEGEASRLRLATLEQILDLVERRVELRRRRHQILGKDWIPIPAAAIEQADRIERLDRASDPRLELAPRGTGRR